MEKYMRKKLLLVVKLKRYLLLFFSFVSFSLHLISTAQHPRLASSRGVRPSPCHPSMCRCPPGLHPYPCYHLPPSTQLGLSPEPPLRRSGVRRLHLSSTCQHSPGSAPFCITIHPFLGAIRTLAVCWDHVGERESGEARFFSSVYAKQLKSPIFIELLITRNSLVKGVWLGSHKTTPEAVLKALGRVLILGKVVLAQIDLKYFELFTVNLLE